MGLLGVQNTLKFLGNFIIYTLEGYLKSDFKISKLKLKMPRGLLWQLLLYLIKTVRNNNFILYMHGISYTCPQK